MAHGGHAKKCTRTCRDSASAEGRHAPPKSATRATLQTLREHGVRVALDDFGTGYSSLGYLTRMPIGHIKIDRSFVTGSLDGGESEAIVRAVLAMAHSLDMHVTVEGIETVEQARILKTMGCDSLQGYYFSRPVEAHQIPHLLSQHWSLEEVRPSHGEAGMGVHHSLAIGG